MQPINRDDDLINSLLAEIRKFEGVDERYTALLDGLKEQHFLPDEALKITRRVRELSQLEKTEGNCKRVYQIVYELLHFLATDDEEYTVEEKEVMRETKEKGEIIRDPSTIANDPELLQRIITKWLHLSPFGKKVIGLIESGKLKTLRIHGRQIALEQLNEEAMSNIFLVRKGDLFENVEDPETTLLLKKPSAENDNIHERRKFMKEGVKRLLLGDSPYLVKVFAIDPLRGFLVYEYIEGGGLDRMLSEFDLYPKQRIKVLLDAAKGLKHMHSLEYVHRDLAARNIFGQFKEDGSIEGKLGDFDRVKDLSLPHEGGTKKKTGPVLWLAPEQLVPLATAEFIQYPSTKQTDVWSFAITMAEILLHNPDRTSAPLHPGLDTLFEGTLVPENKIYVETADDYEIYKGAFYNNMVFNAEVLIPRMQERFSEKLPQELKESGLAELFSFMTALEPQDRCTMDHVVQVLERIYA